MAKRSSDGPVVERRILFGRLDGRPSRHRDNALDRGVGPRLAATGTRPLTAASLRIDVLVAFDDTDDAEGGCTTALVFAVLAAVPDLALRGMPRLVRLNPNVPYKTRGNGAVCLELVHREGPQVQVGLWQGHPLNARPDGRPAAVEDEVVAAIQRAVLSGARPGADPGLVVCADAPPAAVYWTAARTRLEPQALALLEGTGAEASGVASAEASGVAGGVASAEANVTAGGVTTIASVGGRGRVGALAAAAWPGPASSYELLVYRRLDRIGTPRAVEGDFSDLDARGVTFHSYDLEEQIRACVPNTPCPILCGLRGIDPERLMAAGLPALEAAIREPTAGWLLFATNQASGDHVTPVDHVGEAPEWGTIAVPATVRRRPEAHRGGYVEVAMDDARGRGFTGVAFEPTKSFRGVVRALRPGDRLQVVGAWNEGSVRLEKVRIDHLAAPRAKVQNPRCPQCRRTMKSRGKDAGYRCPDGHGKAPEEAAQTVVEPRTVSMGWHEVPVIARRHLHRPAWFETMADAPHRGAAGLESNPL